jgi:hypothetical protein
VTDLICAEAAQRHERASYIATCSKKNHSRSSMRSVDPRSTSTPIPDLELLTQTYQPLESSSMTPMERFVTLSPANDPRPWESRMMMARVGLEDGSMETLDVRVDAAIIVDATRISARFSSLSLARSS